QNYDPRVSDNPNLFWVLAVRFINEQTSVLELLVVDVPQLYSNGSSVPLSSFRPATQGLVLVTHGTDSGIGGPTDGKFGEIAATISNFLDKHSNGQWDVVSLDWSGFATSISSFLDKNELLVNPATSAQVGIGIGESFVRWLDV